MAILEYETQNYYRVDLKNSFVQNNMVFANIIIYASEADRQAEKARTDDFQRFDVLCKNMISSLSGSEEQAVMSEQFSGAVRAVNKMRYMRDDYIRRDFVFAPDIFSLLTECGFSREWLDRPIRIVAVRIVNCGLHTGDDFTGEYIYGKLKRKMSSNIANV